MTEPTPDLEPTTPDENEAQAIHDLARFTDPEHDQVGCWCCCDTCDFDFEAVVGEP